MPSVVNDIGGYVVGTVVQGGVVSMAVPTSRPMAVGGLPVQAVFVGRKDELARLATALVPSDSVAAVLVWSVGGLPGVGKTALAVQAAHRAVAAGWFPGGVVMVNLRGYDQPEHQVSAATALAGLLGALGVPSEHIPPEEEHRAWLWRSLLAERAAAGQRMLVIADNVADADNVRPLLPGTCGHRVLITSRHRLAGLDATRLLDLDVLGTDEAVRMLSSVVWMSEPDDTRVRRDPESTARVARLCGGLPLAVRICAALLVAEPELSMDELADALEDGRHRLTELRYDGSLSVRAAFDLSYDYLDPAQARLFRLMALNPGPDAGLGTVAAVADIGDDEARRLLRQLRRAHLVVPGVSAGRWRMHDLLHLHAAEKAATDPERDAAMDRLFDHYLRMVRADFPKSVGDHPPRAAALARADLEYVNAVAMVGLGHRLGRQRHAIDLTAGMYEYLSYRKHWHEWISSHELALAGAVELGDRAAEGMLLVNLGNAQLQLMRTDLAGALYRRALSVFRLLGDRTGFGRALDHLGLVLRFTARPQAAMVCHRWALRLFREEHAEHLACSALHNIAVGHRLFGRLDAAVACHLQTVASFRTLGEPLYTGRALDFLGVVYRELGRMTEAVRCHRTNLEICAELSDSYGAARCHANLAVTLRESGRPAEAVNCHLAALRTFRAAGPRHRECAELVELGTTYRRVGRYRDAARSLTEAIAIAGTLPSHGGALVTRARAVLAEFQRGELTDVRVMSRETTELRVPARSETTHRLTAEQFGQLCAGPVDAETVALLRSGQYSRRRMLLAALVAEAGAAAENLEKAWELITGADRAEPDLLADVLMSPPVGVWLARTLRRIRGASSDGPELVVELGFLAAMAAAVAVRGRLPCVLRVPATAGVVTLPTVGQVRFTSPVAHAMVTVTGDRAEVAADRVCVIPGGREFVPVRQLEVADGDRRLTVEFDDSTPYRKFSAPTPPGDPARLDAWTPRLAETWCILARRHPAYADEIAAGMATLTPAPAGGRVVGFSSPMAFGAVVASMGDSAAALAARLVHEFQHSKLNAALDLVRFHNAPDSSWYAPWRDEPRPLGSLLHGLYAFTVDVEFWAVERHHVADPTATFRFVHRRRQVLAVVEALDECADLTAAGRELVAATAARLARCPADDVPPEVVERSATIMAEHRATWRLRHVRPDTDHVDALVLAWRAGARPPAPVIGPNLVVPFRRSVPTSGRTQPPSGPEARSAEDHALATGAHETAATGYERRLRADPDDVDAWMGLGLTLRAMGHPAATAFLTEPETTATAWQCLAEEATSPVDFCAWLVGG